MDEDGMGCPCCRPRQSGHPLAFPEGEHR
jgi:hypothetical protein